VGYYPDMSSQAAAQGYFADLIRQAIGSAPIVQRPTGQPAFIDFAVTTVPASSSVSITPNLEGRGIVGVLVSWNSTTAGLSTPRAVVLGTNFSLFNDGGTTASMFWVAFAAG
jgi:hypothetical protein